MHRPRRMVAPGANYYFRYEGGDVRSEGRRLFQAWFNTRFVTRYGGSPERSPGGSPNASRGFARYSSAGHPALECGSPNIRPERRLPTTGERSDKREPHIGLHKKRPKRHGRDHQRDAESKDPVEPTVLFGMPCEYPGRERGGCAEGP